MKIALMGAMVEEITPLLSFFKEYKEISFAGNKYYLADYKGIEVIIAYSKIGKVFSALTAATMIEKFGAKKLLFSGVAGAINPDLKIGDLIVANKLYQHDLDITAFGHPLGVVPEGKRFIEADKDLIKIAFEVAKEKGIKLKEGIIATGDQFIYSTKKKEAIRKEFGADALEMEGASVAVVCDALNTPFLILRSISDSANEKANIDFDTFLEKSSKRSAEFIIAILDKII